jgi:hypothetical protein
VRADEPVDRRHPHQRLLDVGKERRGQAPHVLVGEGEALDRQGGGLGGGSAGRQGDRLAVQVDAAQRVPVVHDGVVEGVQQRGELPGVVVGDEDQGHVHVDPVALPVLADDVEQERPALDGGDERPVGRAFEVRRHRGLDRDAAQGQLGVVGVAGAELPVVPDGLAHRDLEHRPPQELGLGPRRQLALDDLLEHGLVPERVQEPSPDLAHVLVATLRDDVPPADDRGRRPDLPDAVWSRRVGVGEVPLAAQVGPAAQRRQH